MESDQPVHLFLSPKTEAGASEPKGSEIEGKSDLESRLYIFAPQEIVPTFVAY
jgi:hypothetical protein